MISIDLNADVGEECGDDAALFDIVTSANIACGEHAGSEEVMRATLRLARERGVAAGAHPSFPDRANFGRIPMERSPEQIFADVVSQIGVLERIAREEGVSLHHVKAHGALYNVAAQDRSVADAIARAVRTALPGASLYGLAGGAQIAAARAFGLRPIAEGFADRRYRPDGTLVPRSEPDALIENEEEAVAQALDLARSGRVQTICLHGDGAHALAFARRIRRAFTDAGVSIASS